MTIEDLLAEARTYLTPAHVARIADAYTIASDGARDTSTPPLQHALAGVRLLIEMRIDANGILAALLYAAPQHTAEDVLRSKFGEAVAAIVSGLTRFDALAREASEGTQSSATPLTLRTTPSFYRRYQNFDAANQLLLSMAEEPYIAILRVADCLQKMRTLSTLSSWEQQATVSDAHHVYIPLARRLGMGLLHAEMEDLLFRYLEPEKYVQLLASVTQEVNRRRPFIDMLCQTLRKQMEQVGIRAEVSFHPKHLSSVQRKLMRNGQQNGRPPIERVQDLVLFRILVDYDHDCYLALGHIHALWRPKDGRIKDFIATPRLNGYQSLHTTVSVTEQQLAEIQIRTLDMDRTANYGVPNYWYLKDHIGKESAVSGGWRLSYREMRAWIELLREWQRNQPQNSLPAGTADNFREQIFVFTPRGEVKYLPRGATILDMAYRIHSDLGEHCAGGRVITNVDDSERLVTRPVMLDYQLKGGEIVDIIVSPDAHPTQEWSTFARTSGARLKIKRYLKAHEQAVSGRQEASAATQRDAAPFESEQRRVATLASCCCPFPDEPIVGVYAADNEFLVHGIDCRMLRSYYDTLQEAPSMLIAVNWQQILPESYLVPITIVARDRSGLLRDVSAVITDASMDIAEMRTSTTSSLQKTIITATLEIIASDEIKEQIEELFLRLREVMSVVSVERERNPSGVQDLGAYYWDMYQGVVRQTLMRQGTVDPSLFPGVPVAYVDTVLERYIQAHPETYLDYQEGAHILSLRRGEAVQHMDALIAQILQYIEEGNQESATCKQTINAIFQHLSSSVGFGEVGAQDLQGFTAFSIDTQVVFENLKISNQVLVSFEMDLADASIEILRRILLRRTPARVVVLLLFCDNHRMEKVRRRLAQTISKTYAYDIAVINAEDILDVVSAREPERVLRRVILSQVSLSAVSPYKSQGPTPMHLFFGREHELREISENATTTGYVLIGGRRIGKTSMLQRLREVNLPAAGCRTLFHDCAYTPSEQELIQAVRGDKQWFPAGAPAFTSFAGVLQALDTSQPLVILLDEADALIRVDRAAGYPIFNSLRALSNSGLCTFILSGEQAMHAELSNPNSPLYNFVNEMLIGRLDFHAVQELVIRPMKQLEILLQDEAEMVQRVWNFTSGHPSVVQSLCQRLILRLHKRNLHSLTLDDVDAVVSNYEFMRKDVLNIYWERATALERLCTLLMVEDDSVRTLATTYAALQRLDLVVTLNQVDQALENLVDLRNILQRTAEGYEFAVTALPLVITKTGRPHDLIALNCETYRQNGEAEN